jgi:hypothetical protein
MGGKKPIYTVLGKIILLFLTLLSQRNRSFGFRKFSYGSIQAYCRYYVTDKIFYWNEEFLNGWSEMKDPAGMTTGFPGPCYWIFSLRLIENNWQSRNDISEIRNVFCFALKKKEFNRGAELPSGHQGQSS